jgi:hypothetical protein
MSENLSSILPPTPGQKRQIQETISVCERPMKELILAYFALFENSSGPKFKRYRDIAETIQSFRDLPRHFADRSALYYIPDAPSGCPVEEVMIENGPVSRKWEKWVLTPCIVPADSIWDADKRISSLEIPEANRVNTAIGQLLQQMTYSWNIVAGKYDETRNFGLEAHMNNITLSLVDPTSISKADQLKIRLSVSISVQDKIETLI